MSGEGYAGEVTVQEPNFHVLLPSTYPVLPTTFLL